MTKPIFISHSSQDDDFVASLRKSLETQGLDVWVDSRNLRGGDALKPEIEKAIKNAGAFIVVISPKVFNSSWVRHETMFAQAFHGVNKDVPVIPLLLEGMEPAALSYFFIEPPLGIQISNRQDALTESMPEILAALGQRLPDDGDPAKDIVEAPLEELVLQLTDPDIVEEEGKRRAVATAFVKYVPTNRNEREVESMGRFKFTAPLGPIEMDDLKWYLEKFFIWPIGLFKTKAEEIERKLPEWGKMLYESALPGEDCSEVLSKWQNVEASSERRFSVFVDDKLPKGAKDEDQARAKEAATLLLSLPWELLKDQRGYLFLGAKPVQVRRRLPNRVSFDVLVSEPPVRVLLISPRPEDESAGYIDHRSSALPLVQALESLGELTRLTILNPPTFSAMEKELARAQKTGNPYHVVHFDGHGVYQKEIGLGGLCFENPNDEDKNEKRRSVIVNADQMAEVMRDQRIPLVFLEACQTAEARIDPATSVAAALLEQGIASVVAMTHSVLVVTARRFVKEFYEQLMCGSRIGQAMLAGQKALKNDTFRMKIFGAGELHLQDWFVPVLLQEKEDPRLFTRIPSEKMRSIQANVLEKRMGRLPQTPDHEFVGRSRELLYLERVLINEKWAVIRGEGGEGKTTLSVELARWLVRSSRVDQAVFVCVESISDARAVLDSIGQQLVNNYSVAEFGEDIFGRALHPVTRELDNQNTLIVFVPHISYCGLIFYSISL